MHGFAHRLEIAAFLLTLSFWGAQQARAEEPGLSPEAQEWVRNNPPSRAQAQANPVPKDNAHPRISPEEREAIALPAPTWITEGKVHPAVGQALEQQKQIIGSNPRMAWVQFDRPAGFEGTAYVDVYLVHQVRGGFDTPENQAVIQHAQERVLESLTAAEFSLVFSFRNTAGFVGYVNAAGLAKLTKDPRVMAIGLDDQPRPEDAPRATPEQPARGSIEVIGKVEKATYEALEKSADGYVFVIVSINRSEQERLRLERRYAMDRKVQDGVLCALTANEFRLRTRSYGFSGYVNAVGLRRLEEHPDVIRIALDRLLVSG